MIFNLNSKQAVTITKLAFRSWIGNGTSSHAAALAFFMVMPLPSLLLMLTQVSGLIYGQPMALQILLGQINALMGPSVSDMISKILVGQENPFTNTMGSAVGIAFAIFGAIGAFAVLQDILNTIWNVEPAKCPSLLTRLRKRIVPFLMVIAVGTIAFGWAAMSILLADALDIYLEPVVGSGIAILIDATQPVSSFVLLALLFAFIYRQVPDVKVAWRDVWLAAIIVAVSATALDTLFSFYIHVFPVTSISGAAGSLIILLLWVFIVNEAILFGAQFSKIYAYTAGSKAKQTT
jgi:membrane protein